ncbi:uncharacterized protein LOC124439581 [Xenia sp. Carnegie-2017]|uniref:uncharacterized protein LOC124439581 n=1 Tax=Xenia sp. Carnegie-2017 TaxID=2897299 RepID=UPI001F042D25|nr:uncharacterized protein LOC124439581 [Xenia sp. Carnegie-2017]XP_046845799.1 uncharacterized protein LOC124439581 [Xenia sp. Carnegie-2017]XP_046845801.1 uncharacterized protein LOC124439581 [Xenia sp. Carnegie-2017]XP_046845802.1 uncharacterized protein LOC124439581 [Xenia sp. Carnegie-2017]XP_046845803.1 uncharacterized protein LOC124439581 [Xenia sp. Carnegie-2017]
MSKVPAFVLFLSVVYLTLPDNRGIVDGTAHRHDAESGEENNATDGQKDDVKFTPLRKKHGRKKLNKNLAFSLKEFIEAMAEKKVPRKKIKGKHKNRRKHYTSAMHMKSIKEKMRALAKIAIAELKAKKKQARKIKEKVEMTRKKSRGHRKETTLPIARSKIPDAKALCQDICQHRCLQSCHIACCVPDLTPTMRDVVALRTKYMNIPR